jgi:hypothetical protein
VTDGAGCSDDGAQRSIPPESGLGMVMPNGCVPAHMVTCAGLLTEDYRTNLKTVDLAPGESTSMHRTSSLDYNILSQLTPSSVCSTATDFREVQGEVILILDDGTERRISNPGDVVVQKGNIHAWKWVPVLHKHFRAQHLCAGTPGLSGVGG